MPGKISKRIRYQRKDGDNQDHSTTEISKDTQKSLVDLKKTCCLSDSYEKTLEPIGKINKVLN